MRQPYFIVILPWTLPEVLKITGYNPWFTFSVSSNFHETCFLVILLCLSYKTFFLVRISIFFLLSVSFFFFSIFFFVGSLFSVFFCPLFFFFYFYSKRLLNNLEEDDGNVGYPLPHFFLSTTTQIIIKKMAFDYYMQLNGSWPPFFALMIVVQAASCGHVHNYHFIFFCVCIFYLCWY